MAYQPTPGYAYKSSGFNKWPYTSRQNSQYHQKVNQMRKKRKYGNNYHSIISYDKSHPFGYLPKGGENKFHDIKYVGTFDSVAEQAQVSSVDTGMNLIAQGTTENTRIGRKITITSIHINGFINGAQTVNSDVVKMQLVLDRQANGAYPGITDIQEDSSVESFANLTNSKRFTVIKKWFFAMKPQGITSQFDSNTKTFVSDIQIINYNKKCSIPIEYSGTSGAISELASNNLMLWCQSTQDDATSYTLNVRLRFKDY